MSIEAPPPELLDPAGLYKVFFTGSADAKRFAIGHVRFVGEWVVVQWPGYPRVLIPKDRVERIQDYHAQIEPQ